MNGKSAFRICAILLLTSGFVLCGCGRSPASIVERFYRAVGKGEITEAKGYLSAQLGAMLGDAKVTTLLSTETAKVQSCGGIKTVDVALNGAGEVQSGTVTVTYNGKCSQKTEKVKLVKEDGKWKIAPEK